MLEVGDGFGRDIGHIGEVGGVAEAVSGGDFATVDEGDALEDGSEERDFGAGGGAVGPRGKGLESDFGAGGIAGFLVIGGEGVVEDAAQGFEGDFVSE